MQEWLKDKKNLPAVIGLSVFILLGAVFAFLFETGVLPPQPPQQSVAVAPSTPPPGTVPQQTPLPPGAGIPTPGAGLRQVPATAKVATAAPVPLLNAAKGPDPFKVPGYRPFKNTVKTPPLRTALPVVFIQQYTPKDQIVPRKRGTGANTLVQVTPDVSATMRMSGLITTDNSIKALLESNGVSTEVQPGDSVDGGKVISIQPDGLLLRTSSNRLVRVPLSGTSTGGNSPYGGPSPYGGGAPSPYGGGGPPPYGGGGPGYAPPGATPIDNSGNQ